MTRKWKVGERERDAARERATALADAIRAMQDQVIATDGYISVWNLGQKALDADAPPAVVVPTDAVDEPLSFDVSGPKKDEAALRRFVASASFADIVAKATAAARLRLRRDLARWCKGRLDERFVDVFDGYNAEQAKGFAGAMAAVIAHLEALK